MSKGEEEADRDTEPVKNNTAALSKHFIFIFFIPAPRLSLLIEQAGCYLPYSAVSGTNKLTDVRLDQWSQGAACA